MRTRRRLSLACRLCLACLACLACLLAPQIAHAQHPTLTISGCAKIGQPTADAERKPNDADPIAPGETVLVTNACDRPMVVVETRYVTGLYALARASEAELATLGQIQMISSEQTRLLGAANDSLLAINRLLGRLATEDLRAVRDTITTVNTRLAASVSQLNQVNDDLRRAERKLLLTNIRNAFKIGGFSIALLGVGFLAGSVL